VGAPSSAPGATRSTAQVLDVAVQGGVGRLEEMGQEGFEASVGRRSRGQLCGTLAVPGQVGGAEGRVGVSFAIQSDGWGTGRERAECRR
jgi:hypothetical protein